MTVWVTGYKTRTRITSYLHGAHIIPTYSQVLLATVHLNKEYVGIMCAPVLSFSGHQRSTRPSLQHDRHLHLHYIHEQMGSLNTEVSYQRNAGLTGESKISYPSVMN